MYVVESTSLNVSVLFREAFMVLLLLVPVRFSRTLYLPYIGGRFRWTERNKMASASIPSANEPAKDLIFVHTIQLIPMIKAHISGRMVSGGTSDVAIASVHSEKIRLRKLMIIIIMNKSQETTVFAGARN